MRVLERAKCCVATPTPSYTVILIVGSVVGHRSPTCAFVSFLFARSVNSAETAVQELHPDVGAKLRQRLAFNGVLLPQPLSPTIGALTTTEGGRELPCLPQRPAAPALSFPRRHRRLPVFTHAVTSWPVCSLYANSSLRNKYFTPSGDIRIKYVPPLDPPDWRVLFSTRCFCEQGLC